MTTPRHIVIDIYDDPICPNCYMGYVELGTAIRWIKEQGIPLTFHVEYHPLRLVCPGALPEGAVYDKTEFLTKKFGGEENYAAFRNQVSQWAQKRGIQLAPEAKISSSTSAFRLSLKAYQLGGKMAQYPLHGAIYKAHLERGETLSDINMLANIAASLGIMSREDAIAFLESDELKDEVNKQVEENRAKGITRVPTIIFNKRYKFEGAQCHYIYAQALQKLASSPTGTISAAPSPMPTPATLVSASS